MSNYKNIAISSALQAGKLLKENLGKVKNISFKGRIDLVTEMDKKSESLISKLILKNFPDHNLVCEEGTCRKAQSQFTWYIDPLDGTTNYAHGLGWFAVSIGLEKDGKMILGVVYHPMLDELFWAESGSGAFVNNKKIKVSKISQLEKSLLATGYPYYIKESSRKTFEYFKQFSLSAQATRRAGSAAIDLCYTASGRCDGFWEEGLRPWDIAAGSLIITEAGGKVTNFKGKPISLYGKEILASNGLIHKEMLKVIR